MRTIDTNPEHKLALVEDDDTQNTRYIALADAPPLTEDERPTYREQVYLKQHHYVASHKLEGLWVHDRMDEKGNKPPKHGWTRWKNV